MTSASARVPRSPSKSAQTPTGPFDSIAQVTAANEPDVDSTPGNDDGDQSEDDEAKATVVVTPVIDLELDVSASAQNVNVGETVTLTFDLDNLGPSDGSGIVVMPKFPAGLAYVSNDGNGSYDPVTGKWTVGDLASGGDTQLNIVVRVEQPGALTASAEVVAANETDKDSTPGNGIASEDDQDDVTLGGVQIDLAVTNRVVGTTTPDLGDDVTFRVTLTNEGASTASGVTLKNVLPPGLTFVSSNPGAGSYDEDTGIWTVGEVAMGQTIVLDLVATATAPGPQSTTAQVQTAGEPDVDSTPGNDVASEDDQDTASITVVAADLRLTKSVDNANPSVGEEVVYSIVVTNDGPSKATGVQITDELPAGLTFEGANASKGSYNFSKHKWNVGNLAVGASATLHLRATVTQLDRWSIRPRSPGRISPIPTPSPATTIPTRTIRPAPRSPPFSPPT